MNNTNRPRNDRNQQLEEARRENQQPVREFLVHLQNQRREVDNGIKLEQDIQFLKNILPFFRKEKDKIILRGRNRVYSPIIIHQTILNCNYKKIIYYEKLHCSVNQNFFLKDPSSNLTFNHFSFGSYMKTKHEDILQCIAEIFYIILFCSSIISNICKLQQKKRKLIQYLIEFFNIRKDPDKKSYQNDIKELLKSIDGPFNHQNFNILNFYIRVFENKRFLIIEKYENLLTEKIKKKNVEGLEKFVHSFPSLHEVLFYLNKNVQVWLDVFCICD